MGEAKPVLDYSTFYSIKVLPRSPLERLMAYDLEDVILTFVAIRNSLHSNGYDYAKDDFIAAFLRRLPPEKSNRLSAFLFGSEQFALVHTVVVSKILLDLFKRLQYNSPIKDLDVKEFEEDVLDAILIYNENHYNQFAFESLDDSHELVWSLMLMQKLTGVSEVDYARTGNIKHLVFLRFLKTKLGDKYDQFEQSLREKAGLDTPHRFLAIFLEIYLSARGKDNHKNVLPHFASHDPNIAFLKKMNLVIDEEFAKQEGFDIGMLITQPFFLTKNGKAYLLDHHDFSLLVEQVWMYLLYYNSSIKTLLPNLGKFSDFQGFIGLNYYERFLMGTLFGAMEKPGVRLVRSDDRNLSDFTLIVNETDVFVIELKAVSIHYRVFYQQDGTGFKNFIDDNFSGKKGISQLERNIRYLLDDKKSLLSLKRPSCKLTIFPVIVFIDPMLEVPAINDYLAEKARVKFADLTPFFREVRPLTMISSDFFIENIELLQQDRGLFKRLITNYHAAVKSKKRNYMKFRSTENYLKSMVSFDNFVIGKENIYRLSHKKMFKHLASVFKLKDRF